MPQHAGTLVFSHANSFPAGTYQMLFERWRAAGWQVHAIDKFGHDPRYPVTREWPHLVRQLHDTIKHDVGHPVHLVGHSLGGYLSMMVASRHPGAVRGLVVLDSPLVHGWKARGLAMIQSMGMARLIMPSRISSQRRQQWPDAPSAMGHFAAKKTFAAFHPQVLKDYLHHGTQGRGNGTGVSLSFRRDIESDIYDHLPHRLEKQLQTHPLQCPIAFIGGTRSRELRQVGLHGTRRIFGDRITWVEGSHLYPFEHPAETADAVLSCLNAFPTSGIPA